MTVAIRKITVPRQMQAVPQGQTVVIFAEVVDVGITTVLLDPIYVPVISIYNSAGTLLISDAVMTFVSLGVYKYEYQTTTSNTLGLYTVNITVVHIADVARIERRLAFKITQSTTLSTFTYFAIKDQENVVWYWYIANDNTLAFSLTTPNVLGKQATEVIIATTPSWLEINNPTPTLRYVYPEITGEITVSITQPLVGSGNVGSPTLIGVAGGGFEIALNVSDTIILNTV